MTSLKLGSNNLNCPFPLVIGDRFFALESIENKHVFTVCNVVDKKVVPEIIKNTPQDNPYTTSKINPTGFITVCDKNTGHFLYKIRPDSTSSEIFGNIAGGENKIIITDRYIDYNTNRFEGCGVSALIGIQLRKDGGMAIGVNTLPQELIDTFGVSAYLKPKL